MFQISTPPRPHLLIMDVRGKHIGVYTNQVTVYQPMKPIPHLGVALIFDLICRDGCRIGHPLNVQVLKAAAALHPVLQARLGKVVAFRQRLHLHG